ncbi:MULTISPECIES: ATP-binding protein [unclassified Sulfuricurvum]|uniref:ATP-binding protein n=1 Tax=unclassified Sulfuricurvum TaxID=2632390 RepID=UPI000299947D|nr:MULTISPECIES: ATP-binding protein [unclassified Sulfuricurvum]AFV97521.1 hypothetical protein B649_06035 [Candidatus Sulfuricurvum sp. RIFRC-1]HBM35213.1 ATP-binding protein [Sulfuricurvum sp.]
MKITDVIIPANEQNLGLDSIKMYRLGELVVIAGQNGVGKSRLLKLISSTLEIKPSVLEKEKLIDNIEYLKSSLNLTEGSLNSEDNEKNIKGKKRVQYLQEKIEDDVRKLNFSLIHTDIEAEEKYFFLNFQAQSLELIDPHTLTGEDRDKYSSEMDDLNSSNWHKAVLSKIQVIQNQWWDSKHPFSEKNSLEKDKIEFDYERLQQYIRDFLNTELKRVNGQATLYGFPLGQTNLSDGQKILLQLCIALYSLETKLENIILFIDEPENSLHPNILLDTIDKIRSVLKNGQVWIATHSVSLLAHVDPLSIWYMDNGSVSYAGKIPEKVLQGLIGDEEKINELTDFLSLPAQLATIQYAYECLQAPDSVMTDKNDRQVQQIYEYLSRHRPLSLLDFGAGKGRLVTTLFELDKEKGIDTQSCLEYFAYNIDDEDREICEDNINIVYHDSKKRHFFSETDLRDNMNKSSCHIVLMTNVFHEIHPDKWNDEMRLIHNFLIDGGYLMIIEDQVIPKGEKAYKEGFIVLDKAEFKELFSLHDYECFTSPENERLKLHVIPKNALIRITSETKQQALLSHIAKAKREIDFLRSQIPSYSNGKKHAFWTQQFANASLALR